MATSKAKAPKEAKEQKKSSRFNDLVLRNPEDWVLMVLAAAGFANLIPQINLLLGQSLSYAWPIIVFVIGMKKLMDRWK
ncbi:MAG: hypothetical protein N3F07_00300 [Candidatus Micrarchaeota archaeon]|nr:hypothetical protein [Candidatus Micrarchaeota archaeon]